MNISLITIYCMDHTVWMGDLNCRVLQILGKPLVVGQQRISRSSQSSEVTHPAFITKELLSNEEKHWVPHGILAVGLNVSTEQSAWFEHGQHLWPPTQLKYKVIFNLPTNVFYPGINSIPCQNGEYQNHLLSDFSSVWN